MQFLNYKTYLFFGFFFFIGAYNFAFAMEDNSSSEQIHVAHQMALPLTDETVKGNLKTYTESEISLIEEDRANIKKVCFRVKAP